MVTLRFHKLSDINPGRAKATPHRTGKTGFSGEAITYLGIKEGMYLRVASNEDDPNDENLYGALSAEQGDDGLRICKAGRYYYVNTRGLYDQIGFDYAAGKYTFDISKIKIGDEEYIKFTKRPLKGRARKEDTDK